MNGKTKLIVGGVVAGGLMLGAAGLVLGAGIAKADNGQDVQFIQLLDSHGINANGSEQMAHNVCTNLDAGFTPAQEVNAVYQATPLNRDQSMVFAVTALVVYCPWHEGQDYFASQPMSPAAPAVPPRERMQQMTGYAERGGRHGR
jgi:hypothetical protein